MSEEEIGLRLALPLHQILHFKMARDDRRLLHDGLVEPYELLLGDPLLCRDSQQLVHHLVLTVLPRLQEGFHRGQNGKLRGLGGGSAARVEGTLAAQDQSQHGHHNQKRSEPLHAIPSLIL